MIHYDYVSAFLCRMEGVFRTAYIPCRRRNFTGLDRREDCGPVLGVSGVTIAAGLDLGQHTARELAAMGLDAALLARLAPYLGLKKEDAVAALAARPLTITHEECRAVNETLHRTYTDRTAARYARDGGGDFAALPWQAQAVASSLMLHLGTPPRYPVTWGHLLAHDWSAAAHELETGFSRYRNRRREEAALLRSIQQKEAA